jgi:hypothetical protein
MIPSWCRIHRTSLRLDYINTGTCHFIWFCCCCTSGIDLVWILLLFIYREEVINITYLRRYLTYLFNSMCVIIPSWCRKHSTPLGLLYINTGPYHIIWFYSCPYTGIRIQLNVSPFVIGIPRQFGVRYNPLLVPYTPQVAMFTIYKHRTLSCHMILVLSIYRCKNST